MGKDPGKVWAKWDYQQDIILSFLAINKHVMDKKSVFLALYFHSMFEETVSNVAPQVNKEAFIEFILGLQSEHEIDLSKCLAPTLLLLSHDKPPLGDLVLLTDFSLYHDVLTYHRPVEVIKGCYGLVKDEYRFSYRFRQTELTAAELQSAIPAVLYTLAEKNLPQFYTEAFKQSYKELINLLLERADTMKVIK